MNEANLIAPSTPCQFALTAGDAPISAATAEAIIDALDGYRMSTAGPTRLTIHDPHGYTSHIDLAGDTGQPNTVRQQTETSTPDTALNATP